MSDKILQCCYTNASQKIAGKLSSGWQAVAVSEGLPPKAYNKCTELQNVNSTIRNTMVDECGILLNLYEICGDGTYLYVLRTQYGLSDRLGRPNMFSHAFIFSWEEDDILADPGSFLTIDNDNFKTDVEAAENLPVSFIRSESLDIERALEMANLDKKTYQLLIWCVYSQMTDRKIVEPLFIQYDGTEEQMKAIIYCIYYGLPYYLRKKLYLASAVANKPSDKNIIFSPCARQHSYYLIPDTGENNILTTRMERRIERYGYIDYAVRNLDSVNAARYFLKLEHFAQSLGDVTASDELILKIAYQCMENNDVQKLDDAELDERLSDALRSGSHGNESMEKYISDLVREAHNRKFILTDENEESLSEYLSKAVTEELIQEGEKYQIYRLSTLPQDKAARELAALEKRNLDSYCSQLVRTQKGREILDLYYSKVRLENTTISWELLHAVFDESAYLGDRPNTLDKLDSLAYELYKSSLFTDENKKELCEHNDLESYLIFERRLIGEERLAACEENAKETFWDMVTFDNFSINLKNLYDRMRMCSGSESDRMYSFYDMLLKMKGDENDFLREINSYFVRSEMKTEDRSKAKMKMLEIVREQYTGGDSNFGRWCDIFTEITSEMTETVLRIRASAANQDFPAFVKYYADLQDNYYGKEKINHVNHTLHSLLGEIFKTMDGNETEVPLDVWLILGEGIYSNAFDIFKYYKPSVLEAAEAGGESVLLNDEKYISAAKEYIKGKGEQYKMIKKWLPGKKSHLVKLLKKKYEK